MTSKEKQLSTQVLFLNQIFSPKCQNSASLIFFEFLAPELLNLRSVCKSWNTLMKEILQLQSKLIQKKFQQAYSDYFNSVEVLQNKGEYENPLKNYFGPNIEYSLQGRECTINILINFKFKNVGTQKNSFTLQKRKKYTLSYSYEQIKPRFKRRFKETHNKTTSSSFFTNNGSFFDAKDSNSSCFREKSKVTKVYCKHEFEILDNSKNWNKNLWIYKNLRETSQNRTCSQNSMLEQLMHNSEDENEQQQAANQHHKKQIDSFLATKNQQLLYLMDCQQVDLITDTLQIKVPLCVQGQLIGLGKNSSSLKFYDLLLSKKSDSQNKGEMHSKVRKSKKTVKNGRESKTDFFKDIGNFFTESLECISEKLKISNEVTQTSKSYQRQNPIKDAHRWIPYEYYEHPISFQINDIIKSCPYLNLRSLFVNQVLHDSYKIEMQLIRKQSQQNLSPRFCKILNQPLCLHFDSRQKSQCIVDLKRKGVLGIQNTVHLFPKDTVTIYLKIDQYEQ